MTANAWSKGFGCRQDKEDPSHESLLRDTLKPTVSSPPPTTEAQEPILNV